MTNYYNGQSNKCFTYKDLKTLEEILCVDGEELAEIVTRGYDDYDSEGLNCDTFAEGGCDHMVQMFSENQTYSDYESVADHWKSFCYDLKNDHQFSSFALWHRALNVHTEDDADVDSAWFESCVDTFLGLMCDYYKSPNDDIHCALESVWCKFYEEDMGEGDEFPTYDELVIWYVSNAKIEGRDKTLEYFIKNHSKEVAA